MGRYLFEASYSPDGIRGVLKEGGTSRRATVDQVVKGFGGSLASFDFAFGENDVIAIVDLPDAESVAAMAMTITASGAVSIKTTVLLTPEQVDNATKKTVGYRAPGA
jgi:uncharacterized protein with GYD domain